MAGSKESLFSLELVVEKLYVPYVTCRFPAVAFRLLDFPTILISHVELDLAKKIRSNIQSDPYYQIPNQFSELQDKHGNFMMKKGKSCLFKISLDTLAVHLANTPLYIMVIDEFPEVSKLLGNSSLALNETIAAISSDILKNGNTVPSVHGDKGLFKIYSLMGKEIGYIILGFRLLSLGPGLIAHLPATALAKRASERDTVKEQIENEIIPVKQSISQSAAKVAKHRKSANTCEVGLMTVVDKKDSLMQTIDFEDDKLHIAVSDKENVKPEKEFKAMHTQTSSRVRPKTTEHTPNFMTAGSDKENEDEVLLNPNISCPPPLFYNSRANPLVKIERNYIRGINQYENSLDDTTLEDLSGDEHYENKLYSEIKEPDGSPSKVQKVPRLQDAKTVVISNVKKTEQTTNLQAVFQTPSDTVFPLLTALLTELSQIQNPQLVQQAMHNIQINSAAAKQQTESGIKEQESVITAEKAKMKSELESNKESVIKEEVEKQLNVSMKKKKRKSHKACAQPAEDVPKQKGWIRKQPEVGVKKTKLVFGLTNTQRLRLAKGNPLWLKSAEQDEKIIKAQKLKKQTKEKELDQDLETGNLSDTYTEVRRLAAVELEKSTIVPTRYRDKLNLDKKERKKQRYRDNSPLKSKQNRTRSKSPKYKKGAKEKQKSQHTGSGDESNDAEEPVNVEPDTQDIISPDLPVGEKLDSAAESVPSSRIEVHIPSARGYDSDSDATLSDEFENDVSERRDTRSKFPGFNKVDDTLPDSINGDLNKSDDVTLDEDSPLESTRVSKQFQQRPVAGESELFKSTEDYDTKQFHSTDEPELQKLMSEDERSERSESKSLSINVTPKTDRSLSPASNKGTANRARISMNFEVLNPTASQQSPLPAIRRSQVKVDSLNARPSPTNTPRSRDTPRSRSSQERSRSSHESPKQPTPRSRKPVRERRLEFKKESIHTESVSSYVPSESENILSLISDGSYSDDFHMSSEKEDKSSRLSTPELPRLIPSTKLGFTIH